MSTSRLDPIPLYGRLGFINVAVHAFQGATDKLVFLLARDEGVKIEDVRRAYDEPFRMAREVRDPSFPGTDDFITCWKIGSLLKPQTPRISTQLSRWVQIG